MPETIENDEDLKYICKMDYPERGMRGYQVKIRMDGTRHTKYFSVSEHGSWEDAKESAIEHRDSTLKDWRSTAKRPDRRIRFQATNTDVVGISCSKDRAGIFYLQYTHTDEDGEHKNKQFRIGRPKDPDYPKLYDEAMVKAIKYRNKKMIQLVGVRWVNYLNRRNGSYRKDLEQFTNNN